MSRRSQVRALPCANLFKAAAFWSLEITTEIAPNVYSPTYKIKYNPNKLEENIADSEPLEE